MKYINQRQIPVGTEESQKVIERQMDTAVPKTRQVYLKNYMIDNYYLTWYNSVTN